MSTSNYLYFRIEKIHSIHQPWLSGQGFLFPHISPKFLVYSLYTNLCTTVQRTNLGVMEKKKSTSASIENLRFPTVLVGLLFVGGLVLASFSYMTAIEKDIEPEIIKNVTEIVFIEEEQIEIDRSIELPEQHVFLPPDEEIIIDSNTEEAPPVVVTLPPPPLTLPIGDPNPPVLPAEIIDFPDVEAKFPGGSDELQYWINENII